MSLPKQILLGLVVGGLALGAMYLFPQVSKSTISGIAMAVAGAIYFSSR